MYVALLFLGNVCALMLARVKSMMVSFETYLMGINSRQSVTSAPWFFHVSLLDRIFRLSANLLLAAWYTETQKNSTQK